MKKSSIKAVVAVILAFVLSISCVGIFAAAASVKLVKAPDRTTYYQGVDWSYSSATDISVIGSFDISGTTLSYNGKTVAYSVGKFPNMYSKADSGSWKLGENTMRIYCDDFPTSVYATVKVKLIAIESISVATAPKKTSLIEGTDWKRSAIGDAEFKSLDLTGLSLNVKYTDGTVKHIAYDDNHLISWAAPIDADNPLAGTPATINATFCGKTAPFSLCFVTKDGSLLGDVNGDKKINSMDALLILKFSVGTLAFSDTELKKANVNKENNNVNSTDALTVLQYSVGKITEFK